MSCPAMCRQAGLGSLEAGSLEAGERAVDG